MTCADFRTILVAGLPNNIVALRRTRIMGKKQMLLRTFSYQLACLALLITALTAQPELASAQNASYCDGYARDYAQRNSRGHVAGGAARGAIGGALIGGIVRGGKGAGRGALIGGGVGAVAGGVRKSDDYNYLYRQAYDRCMRG
jgi:hypothetical protein